MGRSLWPVKNPAVKREENGQGAYTDHATELAKVNARLEVEALTKISDGTYWNDHYRSNMTAFNALTEQRSMK